MDRQYDAIVIGSGCGGAAAAALASYRGLKTLLLERNPFIGGRAATHDLNGFKMDHCHIMARGSAGPHGQLLKMINCKDLIPKYKTIMRMKPFGHAFGQKIDFSEGMLEGMMSVGTTGMHYLASGLVSPMDAPGIMVLLSQFLLLTENQTHKYDDMDLETYIQKYSRAEITSWLFGMLSSLGFGVMPRETSAGEFIRAMQGVVNVPFNMIAYPVTGEGVAAIPNSFIKAAKRYGAEIVMKAPVEKIVIEGNEARGVVVGGEMIESGMIISNTGFRETAYNLIGRENLPTEYVDRLAGLKYGFGGLCLKYCLDSPIIKYEFGGLVPSDFNRNMTDAMEGRIPDGVACMTICTSNIDPSLAPPGKQLMVTVSPGPPVEVGTVDWEPWVENFKNQIEKYVVPGISKHTIFCEVATPDVIAKESGRIFGDAIGMAQSIDQTGENAPPLIAPVNGVYHVGADVGTKGIGTEMATQSALDLFTLMDEKNLIKTGIKA